MSTQSVVVQYNEEEEDTKNASHVVFSSQEYSQSLIQKPTSKDVTAPTLEGDYFIDTTISSSATIVYIIYKKERIEKLCVKKWRACNNMLYQTMTWKARTQYTIEGLIFNRKFAFDICLGVAPIYVEEEKIHLGELIPNPLFSKLEENVEYALVMQCLDEKWQLRSWLRSSGKATLEEIAFIAKEVALMHKELEPAPKNAGNAKAIKLKWELNRENFFHSLTELFSEMDRKRYWSIDAIMTEACELCSMDFEQRNKEGHIRRCHGDLKTTNLWMCADEMAADTKRLVALDCVDFKPEFYYIDTLSDVAMLIMDIEAHTMLYAQQDGEAGRNLSLSLSQHFLSTYLREQKVENEDILTLLEYYIIEKAVVCFYVSVLYDDIIDEDMVQLRRCYLAVADVHAANLERHLQNIKASTVCKRKALLA